MYRLFFSRGSKTSSHFTKPQILALPINRSNSVIKKKHLRINPLKDHPNKSRNARIDLAKMKSQTPYLPNRLYFPSKAKKVLSHLSSKQRLNLSRS